MSIYVYISRRENPFDDAGSDITAQEWLACVNSETGFRTPTESEKEWLGEYAKIWNDHTIAFAFDWVGGQVEVKGADSTTIAKMIKLSEKLAARVFSETGELFDQSGNHAGFLRGFP